MLTAFKPEDAKHLAEQAQKDVTTKWHLLKQMAEMSYGEAPSETEKPVPAASE
jgi:hypothetical protein